MSYLSPLSTVRTSSYVVGKVIHFGSERDTRRQSEHALKLEANSTDLNRLTLEKQDGFNFLDYAFESDLDHRVAPNLVELLLIFGEENILLRDLLIQALRNKGSNLIIIKPT